MTQEEKHTIGGLLNLLYENVVKTPMLQHADGPDHQEANGYHAGVSASAVCYARTAMETRAVETITKINQSRGVKFARTTEPPLTQTKKKRKMGAEVVTWDAVRKFSYNQLEQTVESHTPFIWHITNLHSNPYF
ncbi:hypothetical protein BDV98DRAFT_586518 [Pterulicium gracile]|uniref:Uncharacterized protein n=1 Tax=Pterulicium gracile TaxID=1884261 RepID=A0A5C3QCI7_9AGAR|nr:hypothetical protein BDV98DRAFT_586518 [Pterula gracilis]